MKLIGIKRLILLAILAGVNAAIAAAYFLWIGPMLTDAQNSLSAVSGEISQLQGKIQNTKSELADYKENLPKYEALKARGFMSGQDRFQISRDLDAVRQSAELGGFSFNISDLRTISSDDATAAQLKVLNSRITLDQVGSMLDKNFYDFAERMGTNFPAHVRLQRMEIKRSLPLNTPTMRRIQQLENVPLLTASTIFDWMTVVPAEQPADPNNPNAPR